MYLGTFSTVDPGEFAGLTQQAGAQWWSASGCTWTVGIDDAACQKVASYWQRPDRHAAAWTTSRSGPRRGTRA